MSTDEEKKQLLRYLYGEEWNGKKPLEFDDPDVATLRSLSLLTVGRPLDFCDYRWPPTGICCWLRAAEMRDVKGLLIATLHRWHELRQEEREQGRVVGNEGGCMS